MDNTRTPFVVRVFNDSLSKDEQLDIVKASEDYEKEILNTCDDLTHLQDVNWSLLQRAVWDKYFPLINFLVGKNINLSGKLAEWVLHSLIIKKDWCYQVGSEEETNQKRLISFLIKKGIGLNDINKALGEAVCESAPIAVEALIESGADVNSVAYINRSPLYLAIHLKNDENKSRIIKALLDAGADINLADKYGDTPKSFMKSLLKLGIDMPQIILFGENVKFF
jgi:hypothetical protein